MSVPPAALLAAAIALVVPSSTPPAQIPPEVFVPAVWGLAGVVSAAITLVIGGLWIAVAPDYTTRVTDRALAAPVTAFLWGFALAIGVFVAAILLAITVVGILVAFPLLLAFGIFSFVAAELGFLAVGRALADGWGAVLAVAVGTAFLLAVIPFLGTLVAFVISSIGVGAVVMDYRASD